MVNAILAGIKTQTRRVFKLTKDMRWYDGPGELQGEQEGMLFDDKGNGPWHVEELSCPYGKPGDRLWVRETFWTDWREDGLVVYDASPEWGKYRNTGKALRSTYLDGNEPTREQSRAAMLAKFWKKRPSIFMPRWASRLTLEITEVRVQQIQEISDADILAEGIAEYAAALKLDGSPRLAWIHLWEAINGKRSGDAYGWHRNPWTWALSFRVLKEIEN